MGKTHTSVESLVGIIVSKTNLQFHRLQKLTLLATGHHLIDSFLKEIRANFTH